MLEKPSIWILLAAQGMSVIGDSFGQRNSRVHHKKSRRHFFISLAITSSIQIFVIFAILQLALPQSISGAIYEGSTKQTCYQETDLDGSSIDCTNPLNNCHVIECPPQGPGSMLNSISMHPGLLLDLALNIIYYATEVTMYREPLGLVFLVLASLFSSFLINPISSIFGLATGKSAPPLVTLLAIGGSLMSVIEKKSEDDLNGSARLLGANENEGILFANTPGNGYVVTRFFKSTFQVLKSSARIIIPFVILSIVYSLWFVLQALFNNQYHANIWGYTSLDQTLLPTVLIPFLLIIDSIGPLKRFYESPEDQKETIYEAFVSSMKEASWTDLFIYRLLINGRAMIYFYLAITFDLAIVYLELTLIRIAFSWLASLCWIVVAPKFIGSTLEEKKQTLNPFNLTLKAVGTGLILAALILLNH